MRCLLAVHGSDRGRTQDTIDSLLPLFNGVACDIVVAAPEQWDMGVLTVGRYSGELAPDRYGFRLMALAHSCWSANRTYDVVVFTDDRCLAISAQSLHFALQSWFEKGKLGVVGVADEYPRYQLLE